MSLGIWDICNQWKYVWHSSCQKAIRVWPLHLLPHIWMFLGILRPHKLKERMLNVHQNDRHFSLYFTFPVLTVSIFPMLVESISHLVLGWGELSSFSWLQIFVFLYPSGCGYVEEGDWHRNWHTGKVWDKWIGAEKGIVEVVISLRSFEGQNGLYLFPFPIDFLITDTSERYNMGLQLETPHYTGDYYSVSAFIFQTWRQTSWNSRHYFKEKQV